MGTAGQKCTVWITGDQCSLRNSALASVGPESAQVLMIESVQRGGLRKYHKQKLVLIYSVMRHFAEELKSLGWEVDYFFEHSDFSSAVSEHIRKFRPAKFLIMQQSEHGADAKLAALTGDVPVETFPHCNFVSSADEFESLHKDRESRVTMERFYRLMRKKTGLLLDGDQPVGGEWNYDKENRKPPGGDFVWAEPLIFPPDKITQSVIEMVERNFADHPGTTNKWIYAVTRADAVRAADDFFENRLDQFGPYQDAMLHAEPFLSHSVLSPYINTCLLHPLELAREAEKRYWLAGASLSSVEGFIRQLIGWREFVWRVYWRLMPEYKNRNGLNATQKLPEFYWTGKTKMRCLSDVLTTVTDYGYAHHIARLMLLGNFALISGCDPLATTEWFNCMFVDGYDWVMVPNVVGMTLHADGGYVGTKPYASSANYINKMSDYCSGCAYKHNATTGEDACPFNYLYWDFLMRNESAFSRNPRMALIMKGLASRDDGWKTALKQQANRWRDSMNQ